MFGVRVGSSDVAQEFWFLGRVVLFGTAIAEPVGSRTLIVEIDHFQPWVLL